MISDELIYKAGYDIHSKTEAPDAGGVVVDTWPATKKNISGHMRTASQREINAQQKDEVVATHVFYCDTAHAVTSKQRIVDPDGQVFEVKTVDDPHGLGEFLKVMCYRSDLEREDDS